MDKKQLVVLIRQCGNLSPNMRLGQLLCNAVFHFSNSNTNNYNNLLFDATLQDEILEKAIAYYLPMCKCFADNPSKEYGKQTWKENKEVVREKILEQLLLYPQWSIGMTLAQFAYWGSYRTPSNLTVVEDEILLEGALNPREDLFQPNEHLS